MGKTLNLMNEVPGDRNEYPPDHPLAWEDEHATYRLMSSRLDIACQIEGHRAFPVLFADHSHLLRWVQDEGLMVQPLLKRSTQAVRVMGNMRIVGQRGIVLTSVDMVWVHHRWRGYRRALNRRAVASGEPPLPSRLHADHVVARSRLSNLPDAWVLLIEVPRHANSGFGARIERHLPVLPADVLRYDLQGMELFKVFCEAMPGPTTGTLEHAFDRVRDQILPANGYVRQMLEEMEGTVREVFHRAAVRSGTRFDGSGRSEAAEYRSDARRIPVKRRPPSR